MNGHRKRVDSGLHEIYRDISRSIHGILDKVILYMEKMV